VAGAYVRHYGTNVAVIVHALLALAVVGHVLPLAIRVRKAGPTLGYLRSSSLWMIGFALAQVVLGITAWLIL
jgi:hypothetical protein